MNNHIKESYSKLVIKLQESFFTVGSNKRVQLTLQYIDIKPNDVLLDVGGNTGKIRGRCLRTKTFRCRIWQKM